jgi:hypothetical protein
MSPKIPVASVFTGILLLYASTSVSAVPSDVEDNEYMVEYSSFGQAGNIYHTKYSPSNSFPADPTNIDGWINYGVVR